MRTSVSGSRTTSGGRAARTDWTVLETWAPHAALVRCRIYTGRTHQIRVHLAHLGHPIAGDPKYGDFAWNRVLAKAGLKRMFLHAHRLAFTHPATGETFELSAISEAGIA